MKLESKINADLLDAMKTKDTVTLETLRAVKTAIKNAKVTSKSTDDLEDGVIISILQKQAKQRQDSLNIYIENGRNDLAEKEEGELKVIKQYLPNEASEAEIMEVLKTIDSTNMGILIKESKAKLLEQGFSVDGKGLSVIVSNFIKK